MTEKRGRSTSVILSDSEESLSTNARLGCYERSPSGGNLSAGRIMRHSRSNERGSALDGRPSSQFMGKEAELREQHLRHRAARGNHRHDRLFLRNYDVDQ